jgi:Uma2 family endonuclease
MVTTTLLTATDLARLSARGGRFELIEGELREMSPVGDEHAFVLINCARHFGNYIADAKRGRLYGGDVGVLFSRNPDTVRAPDLVFVRADRLPLPPSDSSYMALIPDGMFEIVSPYDVMRELDEMIERFLEWGTLVAVKIDPRPRTVTVYRKGQSPVVFSESDDLVIDDLLPGFRLRVSKLFE